MRSSSLLGNIAWLAGLACLSSALMPADLLAAPLFPRGPGFYFDPYKLVILIATFLGWVKLCAWVDSDSESYKIDNVFWNGLLLWAGVGALLLLWSLANFWAAWILFWICIGGVTYWYLTVRNKRAEPDDQLLNATFFIRLFDKYGNRSEDKNGKKKKSAKPVKERDTFPVRFMSRSTTGESAQTDRVERVQQSKGYKSALELVWDAVQKRATDIHLEPTPKELIVRFRIDGIMTNIRSMTRAVGDGVINIFKVVCNLDITEKRQSQDGGFSAQVEDHFVEFRVATSGSVAGEKMVMRILDTSAQMAEISQAGMNDTLQARIREVISQPHGLFLVCGPTGSGKSTTLYACLHEIDRFQQNIITVENPVEYRLDNVTQIEVNPKAGKTFASELRSILRQDPDVIMVGEIRDKETAEIACQAAQTGHLVFSTIHANDSTTAIARMIDLGVPPFMLSTALMGVLAQRLVRKLCRKCRKRIKPSAETLKKLHADVDLVRYLFRAFDPNEDLPKKKKKKAQDDDDEKDDDEKEGPQVCENCGGTGYFKRTGIFELLVLNDRIRELIRVNPNVQEIRKVAVEMGLQSLFEDGTRLVIDGDTSMQELLRVCK